MGAMFSSHVAATIVVHAMRLFVWVPPWLYLLLWRSPRWTAVISLVYLFGLSRQQWWIRAVRAVAERAARDPSIASPSSSSTSRFRFIKTCTLDATRSYLFAGHPHGLLGEGIVFTFFLQPHVLEQYFPGVNYVAVGAPILAWLPFYRELFYTADPTQSKLCDASKRTLQRVIRDEHKSIGIFPGGFSEAVFTAPDNKYEYLYIKDRKGFIKLAIELGIDVVPVYMFGLSSLYCTPTWARGWRARIAQRYLIPMVLYFYGRLPLFFLPRGSHPVYTVVGEPFETSGYDVTRVNEAHAAYLQHVQRMFDAHKEEYGMGGKQLVFVGKDWRDDDCVGRAFRRLHNAIGHLRPSRSRPATTTTTRTGR